MVDSSGKEDVVISKVVNSCSAVEDSTKLSTVSPIEVSNVFLNYYYSYM